MDTTSSVSLAVEDQPQRANGGLQYNGDLQPTEIPVPENIGPTSPPEEIPNNEVLGRKRAKNEDTWKRNQRKRLKKPRQILHIEIKMFLRQCLARKTVNVPGSVMKDFLRLAFFDSFWNLADYSKQNAFFRG